MENRFAVFIISHGRPDKVLTNKTLQKCGYTGLIYYVVDNEDKCIEQYQKNFGIDNVKIFDKKDMADKVDEGNNFDNRRTTTHARNYCFILAKSLGIDYFLVLDDDYYEFDYKFSDTKGLVMPKNINKIFDVMIDFLINSNATAIAFSQTGDFIGGVDNGKGVYRFSKRKCMNSFFCSTNKPFDFIGQLNEDVNTYTTLGSRGNLFLTIPVIAVNQKDTQKQKGGMSDAYLLYGTYCKSFTTTMMQPSSVKVSMINASHKRIHHSINWNNTVPVIISEKHRKQI